MAQSQSFLNPQVPPSSLLTPCAVFFQPQQVRTAPPIPPLPGAGKSNVGALGLPCHLAVAASAFQIMT